MKIFFYYFFVLLISEFALKPEDEIQNYIIKLSEISKMVIEKIVFE